MKVRYERGFVLEQLVKRERKKREERGRVEWSMGRRGLSLLIGLERMLNVLRSPGHVGSADVNADSYESAAR